MKSILSKREGRRNGAGFTLIELMIVIVIIGILAAILIPSFINALDRSRYRSCLSGMAGVKTAMEVLRTETAINNPTCVNGATLNDCLAEELIGEIGGAWAVAADLEGRIDRSCNAWGAGRNDVPWTIAGILATSQSEYTIKGAMQGCFHCSDICISETDYAPDKVEVALRELAVVCP